MRKKHTIHSHNNDTVEIRNDINNVKLKWDKDKIVLCNGNSPLKVEEKNSEDEKVFIIEQEAIRGENKNVLDKVKTEEKDIVLRNITDITSYLGVGLSFMNDGGTTLTGVLNFMYIYTGCPRRNVSDFGRVFLMLKYTDITQNTYVQR